jgi:hypothetical protein
MAAATKEELVALVERLASSSEELAARIDYVTDPGAAGKALQRRISAFRSGKRFIAYGESGQVAAEMAMIAEDIQTDVLPRDPVRAAALAPWRLVSRRRRNGSWLLRGRAKRSATPSSELPVPWDWWRAH